MPELRFPEFEGEWSSADLISLASPVKEKAKNVHPENVLTLSAEHGIVRQTDFFGKKVAGKNLDRYIRIIRDDFVYNDRTTSSSKLGTIKRQKHFEEGAVSPIYKCFRFDPNELPEFWSCYFEADAHEKALGEHVNEGARAGRYNISIDTFLSIFVRFPNRREQQKIADCLGSLDDLIAAHRARLDALHDHKKGLLQQLFPAEGKTTPALRFPEFRDAGEWEEVELGSKIEIKGRIGYRGYTVNDIVERGEGAVSVSPSNIRESGELSFNDSTYISWAKYEESPEIMLERGFTLLVKTGSTYGKVAYVGELPEKATINPQIVILKPKSIHPVFLSLLVAGNVVQSKIEATVVGGAIPTLSQESISKFKVRLPSECEQTRIANCLSSLESLITAAANTVTALESHKKGLMQRLFPNPDLARK